MKNMFFKGLNKALDEGSYIKVFSCSLRYPVVRVEKKNTETNEVELISYAENGNVLSALNSASIKIVNELLKEEKGIWCDRTSLDKVVEQGYPLRFYKLPYGHVLSMICSFEYGDYVPLVSVMSNNLKNGFEMLNAVISSYEDKCKNVNKFFQENNIAMRYEITDLMNLQAKPVKGLVKTRKSNSSNGV